MRTSKFNALNHIAALNKVKKAYLMAGNKFTRKQIKESLQACNLPTNSGFVSEFLRSHLFRKCLKGVYAFVSENPIHYVALDNIYKNYINRCRSYHKPATQTIVKVEATEFTVEDAIKLLKENGYKILKPTYIEI